MARQKVVNFTLLREMKFVDNLIKRNKKLETALQRNLIYAGDDFIDKIKADWYSGRKGGDIGLYRRTGELYRGWQADVKGSGLDMTLVIRNSKAYGRFHEYGVPKRNLPRRTFVRRDLLSKTVGKALIRKAMLDSYREAF